MHAHDSGDVQQGKLNGVVHCSKRLIRAVDRNANGSRQRDRHLHRTLLGSKVGADGFELSPGVGLKPVVWLYTTSSL